jgi:hypothetical protein
MHDDRQFVFAIQRQADGWSLHDMAAACGSGDGGEVDLASVEQRADRGNTWLSSGCDCCQRDGLHVLPALDQLLPKM